MRPQDEITPIIHDLRAKLQVLFPGERIEAILFGSYARREAEEGSDIDVLLLVDCPRQSIADKNWKIGEIAAALLLDYGIVVSPLVENRAYYHQARAILPFFKNIDREGIRISA